MSKQPKKKDLFRFFKSNDFNEARVKMCAMFIILSYANELHEDIDKLLKGYEGLFIGDLKRASKKATNALEEYDRMYVAHISGDGRELGDATVDVTTALDKSIEMNSFYLHEGYQALRKALDEQIENRVKDPNELEREFAENFEIVGPNETKLALEEAKRITRRQLDEIGAKDESSLMMGVEIGFTVCANWINRIYLEK